MKSALVLAILSICYFQYASAAFDGIREYIGIALIIGGLFMEFCGYNWPRVAAFVAAVTIPTYSGLCIVDAIPAGQDLIDILYLVVSIALIIVSVIVWWKFDRWGRICLGFSLGVVLGWIIVSGIIHTFLRKAYIDAFIYIIPGIITAVLTLNKRRYLWILECVTFAGYIFVHSVGGWVKGFEEISPFKAPEKMNYVQYAYIAVAIAIAIGGFIFQWKRTKPDINEGKDDIGWSKKRLLSEQDIEKNLNKPDEEEKKKGIRFGWFGGSKSEEKPKAGSEFGTTQSSVTKPTKAAGNEFGTTQSTFKKNKPDANEFGSTRAKKVDEFGFGSGNKEFHGKAKTSADAFGR